MTLPYERIDVIVSNKSKIRHEIIKSHSLVFINGLLATEGLDNHYNIIDGELEIHDFQGLRTFDLTILTFKTNQ